MNYELLNVELANVECDKALLMVESVFELDECDMYTEGKKEPVVEQHKGLIATAISKVQKLFESIRDWFSKHFAKRPPKGTKTKISKDEMVKHKRLRAISEKLKNGCKNKKKWIGLAAAIGSVGIAGGVAIHNKHKHSAENIVIDMDAFVKKQKEINDNLEAAAKSIADQVKNGETPDEVAEAGNQLLQAVAENTRVNFSQMKQTSINIQPITLPTQPDIKLKRKSESQRKADVENVKFGDVMKNANREQRRAANTL